MTLARSIFIFLGALIFSVLLWSYVRLSAASEVDMDLPVKLTAPKGFALASGMPERLHTRVRGAGWQILLMGLTHNAAFRFDLSERTVLPGDIIPIHSDELVNSAVLPSELRVLKVEPDSLELRFAKAIQKVVPIEPRLDVEPASGYLIVGVPTFTPHAVLATGAASILDSLYSIPTQAAIVRNAREDVERTLPLSDSLGNFISISNAPAVTVHISVEAVGERRVVRVPVAIEALPPQYELILIPSTVAITVRGGVGELAKLTPQSIHASVMYNPVVLDTASEIVPEIEVPT
ncbi:MAG: YbbR-like domain-containing protein, partial [Candidatus Kapaibacterium sp.]